MSHPPTDEPTSGADRVPGTDPVPDADRGMLTGVAFRMLGSRAEADDAVQEAYTRWYAQPADTRAGVVSPTGWLVTVVSRICLDVLKSARVQRERYVGPWLPEPQPTPPSASSDRSDVDPSEQITLDESVTMAMLTLMETMSPAERVAFVLHDVFGFPFADIAAIVGRTPAACRQLASTGRRKARSARPAATADDHHRAAVTELLHAWRARDLDALVTLLDPDAVAVVDGGGLVSAPTEPVHGPTAIAHLLLDATHRAPDLELSPADVNGTPGIVARDHDGNVLAVVSITVTHHRIATILATRNPHKLTAWT